MHVELTLQIVTKSETRKRHHDWGGDYSHPLEWGPGEKRHFYAPIDVSHIYGNYAGHTGSIVRYIGDSHSADGVVDTWEVREAPAEIATLISAAEREEKVRANARRMLAHAKKGTDMHLILADALEFEDILDAHFAAGEGADDDQR